jgi:hypothetical protein
MVNNMQMAGNMEFLQENADFLEKIENKNLFLHYVNIARRATHC